MSDLRVPPQNIEAEQNVLGSILIEPDSILKVSDILRTEDFYKKSHRLIYEACLDIYRHDDFSTIILNEYLKSRGEIEDCGGLDYIINLFASTPTSANIVQSAKIVKTKAVLRNMSNWAYEIQNKISKDDVGSDVKGFLNELEKALIDFTIPLQEPKPADISSILLKIEKRWRDEKEGIKKYIPTDDKFDSIIPRYVPGHLWIIGGYTSAGKSTLVAQMLTDVCGEGAKAVVFSLEDSQEDKTIKILANLAYAGQTRLMVGDTTGLEDKISKAKETLNSWDIAIYDDVYNVDEMRLKIKKHKLQKGVDVVVVDFIQNITGEGTLYEKLSDGIVKLQKMAKELEVTMLVVSQVSNEAMRSNSEIIGLKGAGELSAAADIILWLKRVKGVGCEKHLDVEVRKNRPFGYAGIINLMFNEMWSKVIRRY